MIMRSINCCWFSTHQKCNGCRRFRKFHSVNSQIHFNRKWFFKWIMSLIFTSATKLCSNVLCFFFILLFCRPSSSLTAYRATTDLHFVLVRFSTTLYSNALSRTWIMCTICFVIVRLDWMNVLCDRNSGCVMPMTWSHLHTNIVCWIDGKRTDSLVLWKIACELKSEKNEEEEKKMHKELRLRKIQISKNMIRAAVIWERGTHCTPMIITATAKREWWNWVRGRT